MEDLILNNNHWKQFKKNHFSFKGHILFFNESYFCWVFYFRGDYSLLGVGKTPQKAIQHYIRTFTKGIKSLIDKKNTKKSLT